METRRKIRAWKRTLGVVLFVLSFALYGFLLIMPLVSLSIEVKATLSVMIVISAEGSFWLSVIILGREAIEKFRKTDLKSRISRWLKHDGAVQGMKIDGQGSPDDETDENRQI